MSDLDAKLDRGRPPVRRPPGRAGAPRDLDRPGRAPSHRPGDGAPRAGRRGLPSRSRRRVPSSPAPASCATRATPTTRCGRWRATRSTASRSTRPPPRGPARPAPPARPERRSQRDPRDPRRRRRRRGRPVRGGAAPDVRPLRRAAPLHAGGAEPQRDRDRWHQGGDHRGPRRRCLQPPQVRGRGPSRPAHPGDRVVGADPHLDRDRRRDARGRRDRDRHRRGARPPDRRQARLGAGRPVGQHDRLGGPRHPPADGSRRRDPGREEPAQEQGQGDRGAPLAAVRPRAPAAARGRLGGAPVDGRLGRPVGQDPDLQLPAGPRDRPPHREVHAQPAGRHGRRPRRAHRRPDHGRPGGAARRRSTRAGCEPDRSPPPGGDRPAA